MFTEQPGANTSLPGSLDRIYMSLLFFRHQKMIQGPIYAFRIKRNNTFDAPELLYSLCVKGSTNFGVMDMDKLGKENGRKCLTKRLRDGDSMSWEDCLEAAKGFPPIGAPLQLLERIFTFAEMGTIAYKEGIFDNKDASNFAKATKPGPGSSLLKVAANPTEIVSVPSQQKILAAAKQNAERMSAIQASVMTNSSSSQSVQQLTNIGQYKDVVTDGVVDIADDDEEMMTRKILVRMMQMMKA